MTPGTGIVDESTPVIQQDIEAIISYLPVFERPGYSFGDVIAEKGIIPWVDYSAEVLDLYQDLYHHHFIIDFDWPSWQNVAIDYYQNPDLIKTADLQTLRRLFTIHIRKDRFCEGHLLNVLESGHITAMLERLAKIYESMVNGT